MWGKKTYQQEEQIRRYVQNEMTNAERNAFEREMQKDPFQAEAVDGFSAFPPGDVFADVETLKTGIRGHRHGNQRYIWYAAASVLLIIVSTFFLFNLEKKTNPVVTGNMAKPEQQAAPSEKMLFGAQTVQRNETEQKQSELPEKETMQPELEFEMADTEIDPGTGAGSVTMSKAQAPLSLSPEKQAGLKRLLAEDKILQVVADKAQQNIDSPEQSEKFALAEEQSPVSGIQLKGSKKAARAVSTGPGAAKSVAFLVAGQKADTALNEVTVVGDSGNSKKSVAGAVAGVSEVPDRKAAPRDGWKAYNEYLSVELQHPEIGLPEKKVVVRLSFVVDESGKPGSFEILRSSNEKYNQVAIEFIREGPAWVPAMKNSILQSEKVKLKLVFPKIEK